MTGPMCTPLSGQLAAVWTVPTAGDEPDSADVEMWKLSE